MSIMDSATVTWRRSSRSGGGGDNGNCVEIALVGPAVAVRDSKNSAGPALTFVPAHWRAFLTATKAGHFDHR